MLLPLPVSMFRLATLGSWIMLTVLPASPVVNVTALIAVLGGTLKAKLVIVCVEVAPPSPPVNPT